MADYSEMSKTRFLISTLKSIYNAVNIYQRTWVFLNPKKKNSYKKKTPHFFLNFETRLGVYAILKRARRHVGTDAVI
jgi:hypothetical protein